MRNLQDRGFALISVAIALAVLSLIFAAVIATSRQQAGATADAVDRLHVSAALEGALASAEADLIAGGAVRPALLAEPRQLRIGDIAVAISARPEAGKLDLNMADPVVLRRYFDYMHLPLAVTNAAMGDIAARRADEIASRNFEAVSELRMVPGLSDDMFDCIAGDLTVYTLTRDPDAAVASAPVRQALGKPPQPDSAEMSALHPVMAGEIFDVVAETQGSVRQTIIRITGNQRDPLWVLSEVSPARTGPARKEACARVQARAAAQ